MTGLTGAQKLKLLLDHPAAKIAASGRLSLQYRWNNGGRPHSPCPTEQERYEDVLGEVRGLVGLLMPEHEEKAREVYALMPWPVAAKFAPADFGPVPTFEKFVGRECPTCGGSGTWGFISGQRCPDC